MALTPPTPFFTASDRRLILLLERLLLEGLRSDRLGSNLPSDIVALTIQEAKELADSLEDLANSSDFIEACYFIEGLTLSEEEKNQRIREIFLSARKRRGRTRAMASMHWSEFLTRLGLEENAQWRTRPKPMDMKYFYRMEEALFSSMGLHKMTSDFLLPIIKAQESGVEESRKGKNPVSHGTIRPLVADPSFRITERRSPRNKNRISKRQIAASIIVITNISVLFTTRDWSVTGTLSTIAGALAATVADT